MQIETQKQKVSGAVMNIIINSILPMGIYPCVCTIHTPNYPARMRKG